MNRARDNFGRYQAKSKSPAHLILSWLLALLSLLLLWPTGVAVLTDISSFRSCNINSSDLAANSCGRQGPNLSDLVILIVFLGAVSIVLSLFTYAWRVTRRQP